MDFLCAREYFASSACEKPRLNSEVRRENEDSECFKPSLLDDFWAATGFSSDEYNYLGATIEPPLSYIGKLPAETLPRKKLSEITDCREMSKNESLTTWLPRKPAIAGQAQNQTQTVSPIMFIAAYFGWKYY